MLLAVYGPGQTGSELVVFDARTGEQQTFAVLDDLQPTALAAAPRGASSAWRRKGSSTPATGTADPLPVANRS